MSKQHGNGHTVRVAVGTRVQVRGWGDAVFKVEAKTSEPVSTLRVRGHETSAYGSLVAGQWVSDLDLWVLV